MAHEGGSRAGAADALRVLIIQRAVLLALVAAAALAACSAPQKPDVIPPSLQGLTFAQLKSRAESPAYPALTESPALYAEKLVTYSGKVSEVLSDEYESFNMIVDTNGDGHPVKLRYALNRGVPVAVGRSVEFMGLFKGVVPVKSAALGNVRMPEISVVSMR